MATRFARCSTTSRRCRSSADNKDAVPRGTASWSRVGAASVVGGQWVADGIGDDGKLAIEVAELIERDVQAGVRELLLREAGDGAVHPDDRAFVNLLVDLRIRPDQHRELTLIGSRWRGQERDAIDQHLVDAGQHLDRLPAEGRRIAAERADVDAGRRVAVGRAGGRGAARWIHRCRVGSAGARGLRCAPARAGSRARGKERSECDDAGCTPHPVHGGTTFRSRENVLHAGDTRSARAGVRQNEALLRILDVRHARRSQTSRWWCPGRSTTMAAMTEQLLTVTPEARAKIDGVRTFNDFPEAVLRVRILAREGVRFRYEIALEDPRDRTESDVLVELDGLAVAVDPDSAADLAGATIDLDPGITGGGLTIDNPNEGWQDPVARAVQEVIDRQINPGVGSHGGMVTLVDVRDGTAYLQFGGGCQGCAAVDVTLKHGVETAIRAAVPSISAIVDATDHDAGANPYYQHGH